MRHKTGLVVCGLLLMTVTIAAAAQMARPKDEKRTVTQVLDNSVLNMEHEFVPAAEAMPEDKFSFVPTGGEFKGARTFGEQIRHVAAVNYMLGAALLEQKPPVDLGGESGPTSIASKADIIKFLKESFAYVHKAIATVNETNLVGTVRSPFGEGSVSRLGVVSIVATHGFDHYGQMVVYLRMNGIVPPASR